jgi:hypothetical protein
MDAAMLEQLQTVSIDAIQAPLLASTASPTRSAFPLPNELLDLVLEHLVDDNLESPHDVLSFLLTCRACNRAEFQKFIYRTMCFEPSREGIAALQKIADNPDCACHVKALVYKDVAPKELDKDTLQAAGLSELECEFHDEWAREQHKDHHIMFWLRNLRTFPNLEHIQTLHYKPGFHAPSSVPQKTLKPLSQVLHVDPEAAAHGKYDADLYRQRLYQNRSVGGLYVFPTVRTKGDMGLFSTDSDWIEESMDGFYALLERFGQIHGAQLTTLSMRLVSRYLAGFTQSIPSDTHITTLKLKYEGGNASYECFKTPIRRRYTDRDLHSLFLTRFPHLKHLSLSGKSLAEEGTLDLTKLWGQGSEQPSWAKQLETFTVDRVEFSKLAIQLIIELPVELRMTNAVFREGSFKMFERQIQPSVVPGGHVRRGQIRNNVSKNILRSAKVSGLIIITDESSGRYDRVWVVGSEFAAAEAIKPYRKHASEPSLLQNPPRVQPEEINKYVVSGGLSPLKGENMWTTSECLDLGNQYACEVPKPCLASLM